MLWVKLKEIFKGTNFENANFHRPIIAVDPAQGLHTFKSGPAL